MSSVCSVIILCVSLPVPLISHDLFNFLDAPASLLSIVDRLYPHTVALQTSLILAENSDKKFDDVH